MILSVTKSRIHLESKYKHIKLSIKHGTLIKRVSLNICVPSVFFTPHVKVALYKNVYIRMCLPFNTVARSTNFCKEIG